MMKNQLTPLRSVLLALLLLALTAPATALFGQQNARGGLFGGNNDMPSADEAIRVDALANTDHQAIDLIFEMLDQVYLYQHAFSFRLTDTYGNLLDDFQSFSLPDGELKQDELFGEVQVYFGQLSLRLPLSSIPLTDTLLEIEYQGCLDNTLCYPPQAKTFPLTFVSAEQMRFQPPPEPAANDAATSDDSGFFSTLSSQDANAFSRWLGAHNLGMVLLLFFVGGLLLAFTPCVFPMIPILSGIIAGQAQPTAQRGFLLSTAYVLGMAIPYTLAGLLVALFGAGLNLQFLLQQPAAIITSAVVFVILALGMFGLFTLQLPAFMRDRLNAASERRQGGSLGGAALIGAISGLIVSPCVTPILAGALIYVAGTGDATTGALSLFALAMGMGTPLIIFGTGGSHLLPRVGAWMDDIKQFFGVVMLGVAIWLLSRIVPAPLALALYGSLLVAYGVQLGLLEAGTLRLRRALALLLAIYGTLLITGGASGGSNPWQPLAPRTVTTSASVATTTSAGGLTQAEYGFIDVRGQQALHALLAEAQEAGRPVLVDFFAEWCVACKVLEETTLSDPAVLAAMEDRRLVLVRADVTTIDRENQAIMAEYDIFGLPSLVFLDSQGNEIAESRVLGEMSAERFLSHLNGRVFPSI